MPLKDEFKHITSRVDFFRALDEAVRETNDRLAHEPNHPHLEAILVQLDNIKRWTADGREPTEDERYSTTIGQVLFRELESGPTDEVHRYVEHTREVEGYFQEWPDDAALRRGSSG